MIQAQRFEYIMHQLECSGVVTVSELTQTTGSSRSTIRRDLFNLEQQGKLKCTRGGAVSLVPAKASCEPFYAVRQDYHVEEKRRIANAALEYIQPNDTVILDSGTTVLELAKLLRDKRDLYIATNDLHGAMELSSNPAITLMMLGGCVRTGYFSINGIFTTDMLRQIHADIVFLGADAIDSEIGLMTFSPDELQTKRMMIKSSRKSIVLCDHSKFSAIAFANVAPLSNIDLVITGREVDPNILKRLKDANVNIQVV